MMIALAELKKEYKDFTLNVSMEVGPGVVCGLIGKNGAGKSTTIKSILGLIRPTGGKIEVFGKDPKDFSGEDKAKIGVCLADSGFGRTFCIKDIISIMKNMYSDFDEKDFREKCSAQDLPFDKPLESFSTGMKAKLRVLTALRPGVKLLILDEPTAGLDVMARNEILDMLRAFMAEDEERSMLISSHISSDLEGLCDEIYMINDGRIALHEDTDTLLGNYAVLKLGEEDYQKIDRSYILRIKEQSYGYECLTNEKRFYLENYPSLTIENSSIDEIIMLMIGGEEL